MARVQGLLEGPRSFRDLDIKYAFFSIIETNFDKIHRIVTKTVHKTLPGVLGLQRMWIFSITALLVDISDTRVRGFIQ